MRATALLLPFASLLLLASCKKETDAYTTPSDPSPTASISDFSKLTVGNYWVYERVKIDSLGNNLGAPYWEDSVFVAGDTVLNGQEWFMLGKAHDGSYIPALNHPIRDSADCLVDKYRGIQYCVDRYDQVLQIDSNSSPIQAVIHWFVSSSTFFTSVPSGAFESYRMMGDVTMYGLPPAPVWKFPRRYWVSGVGKVQWFDFYAASNEGYRYDLVRYHVQ